MKKWSQEHRKKKQKEMYQKLLRGEPMTIVQLGKLLMKGTDAIRRWEWQGIIKKPQKNKNNYRIYTLVDIYGVVNDILQYDWQRINFD